MRLAAFLRGNTSVRTLVCRQASGIVVSPHARRALKREVLPQLEESVTSEAAGRELYAMTEESISESFKSKDETYTRLIGYKTIDQSDEQFLEDLIGALRSWARCTFAALG